MILITAGMPQLYIVRYSIYITKLHTITNTGQIVHLAFQVGLVIYRSTVVKAICIIRHRLVRNCSKLESLLEVMASMCPYQSANRQTATLANFTISLVRAGCNSSIAEPYLVGRSMREI